MRRRDFIALIGSAVAWPLTASAQQGESVKRVGVLMGYLDNDLEAQAWAAAFHQGLQKLGWVEGRNLHSDSRWARGEDMEQLQKFARELVALEPHVILSSGTPSTAALLKETRSIPIVFAAVTDPTGSDFVANFDRPGGNVTGMTLMNNQLGQKRLEVLLDLIPKSTEIAMLVNPISPDTVQEIEAVQAATPRRGVQLRISCL